MSSKVARGVSVAVLQLLIVGSLAAKYSYERATCPRIWVKVNYYDPNLPIRGRYASLQLEVSAPGVFAEKPLVENHMGETPSVIQQKSTEPKPRYITVWDSKAVRLEVKDGQLVAISDPSSNVDARYFRDGDGKAHTSLAEPVNFFVPENAANLPGWEWPRTAARDWWAEVTVPKKGPPRPIRLGLKQPGGQIMPLPAN
jgi:hypothetical protein